MIWGWLSLLTLALAAPPEVTVTHIDNLPNKLFYFDDTPVVLIHDPVTLGIARSDDEGKTWNAVPDVVASRLISHPDNNEMAFAIGKSQHWVTYNRGQSWQSFETPVDASITGETLSFHSAQPEWIMFQGKVCEDTGSGKWGGGKTCWDQTYYTKDAFRSAPIRMLDQTSQCTFAKSELIEAPDELVFCIAFDSSTKPGGHSFRESRLYSSTDWFETKKLVDLGVGRAARGVVGLGVVSKFIVCAVKMGDGKRAGDPMSLFVSTDGKTWRQSKFPHSALPDLRENAYTIVESTTHSLAVDILTSPSANIGTLFVSSGEGTYFVQALADTNRNEYGIVDFESLVGLEGVGIANVVSNREEVVGWSEKKKLKSYITYDDGSAWQPLLAPKGKWSCDTSNPLDCSLHVHSVSTPRNLGKVFSSTAPGFVMAVGSVGTHLLDYQDCDTFLSTDAGLTWRMVQEGAHKYEFGDQGSILVIVNDEEATDHVLYSYDGGATWDKLDIGVTLRTVLLTTIPDSTSQKFLLVGTTKGDRRNAIIFLDFAPLRHHQCQDGDFEKWYARSNQGQCLMGHKQWYKRRKLDAVCYVGNKYQDPVGHEESCPCEDHDFECDFNYVRQGGECIPVGPEPVPQGTCQKQNDKYMGSSGYRRIPGNTCAGGIKKDAPVEKDCSKAQPEAGQASHVVHEFPSPVNQQYYFEGSATTLLHLQDGSVWQSSNEGFSWRQLYPETTFLGIILHSFSHDRAYLIPEGREVYFTTDTGRSWMRMTLPMTPNTLGLTMLDFHPTRADWIIFTGSVDCETMGANCRAVAHYSTDHGRRWKQVESYVRTCAWARDARLKIDEREIICESYRNKRGSQQSGDYNPIELVAGSPYYSNPKRLFDSIVGFASFAEYLLVAQLNEMAGTLTLQVSLDGYHFAEGQFPPTMRIENRAYTILESSTDAVFLHVTMNSADSREWGNIFKSNSNGTYYGLSLEHVNRNTAGYVDFEKMIGLDGIALVNIVSNPQEADISGFKKIQSRITHNDGGTWKPLPPPAADSLGEAYECQSTSCSLQIHGYTERRDVKATYSSPSAVGLMLAVGNVGTDLAAYTDSDIFLTRDGGFSWEEIHKDAHLWEFGDSGGIIVIVNDEEPTDHVLFTLDQGRTWTEYEFGETLRVASIQTVTQDDSRRFVLLGQRPGQQSSVIVHLDFTAVTLQQCVIKPEDPNHDDFELWSPSEGRDESCLFGRQTRYHRRIRDRNCHVGNVLKNQPSTVVKNCTCGPSDFECEFNHYRRDGKCVLVDGATALSVDTTYEQCDGAEFWYERTAYRKIPYSSCEGGERPDRGARHVCPAIIGIGSHGAFFWMFVALIPFGAAGLAGWWWYKTGGVGAIRLDEHRAFTQDHSVVGFIASVPFAVAAACQRAWAWIEDRISARGYRPIDSDAEVLGHYDDE